MKVGISTCLLGENVRYDGTHKLDRYLRDVVGKYIEWVGVCPEVECGLPVPREAMRLVGNPERPILTTIRTHRDLTEQMESWARGRLDQLAQLRLCGFVFKTKSPSSGLSGVKVYTEEGMPSRKGSGIFARMFVERFPLLPVTDEGRLHDPDLRENFIENVFTYARWQEYVETDGSKEGLVKFHTRHKLLVMAHDPGRLKELGLMVAGMKGMLLPELHDKYFALLMDILKKPATVPRNVNVLQHTAGYFKRDLPSWERTELARRIEEYQNGYVPLIVPLVLVEHYVRKLGISYLADQYYLTPHPAELALRNHV